MSGTGVFIDDLLDEKYEEGYEEGLKDRKHEITLCLDRKDGDLWLNVNDSHKLVIWGVTGLKRDKEYIRILRKGKRIGIAWNVEEIKERW